MDIIGRLPVEISQYIFDCLPVEDLGRCLVVSKKWREIANCDFLWKKYCLKHELPEKAASEEPLGLCTWASTWNSFSRLPAYKWHSNKYEELEFASDQFNYSSFAFNKNYFVAYSQKHNNLDVYCVSKSGNNLCNRSKLKLVCSIALCFPPNAGHKISLSMSEKYIVAVKCNILLIFSKLTEGNYELYKAINVDFPDQFVTRGIKQFVEQSIIENYFFEPYDVVDNFFWFTLPTDCISFVIDIENDNIRNAVVHNAGALINNFFINWSSVNPEGVRVYDRQGNLVALLENIWLRGKVLDIAVNETLLCIQGANLHGEVSAVVWEIALGEPIFSKTLAVNNWMKLHPNEEVLYLLETLLFNPLYLISAWDVRNSVKLWVYEDRHALFTLDSFETSWNLEFICGKYLISWPLMSEPLGLCTWASTWNSFGRLPAYKWHSNKYEELEFASDRFNYSFFAFNKNYFVAYSQKHNNLDVYCVSKSGNNLCNRSKLKLVCSIALCFPPNAGHKISLSMSEKYIVAVKCNILLIFSKLTEGNYELYKAINVNFPHQFVTRGIKQFVEQRIIENYFVEPYDVVDNFFWFTLPTEDISFVVDIANDNIRNVVVYDAGALINNFFITWSPVDSEGVRVYDRQGNLVVFLEDIGQVEDIAVNETLLCIQGANLDEEVSAVVWEIASSEPIFFKTLTNNTWIKLHPNEEVLYLLETLIFNPLYLISAWDVRNSVMLWVYEDHHVLFTSDFFITSWNLEFICGKYLISWPLMSGKNKFACLSSKSGKLIYESYRPNSNTIYNHIFDTVWISIYNMKNGIGIRAYN